MISSLSRYLFTLLALLTAQLILNRTGLESLLGIPMLGIYPLIYLSFLITLPFNIARWALLAVAFMLGALVDVVSGTYGVHTSATLFIAFMRPFLLERIAPRDGYEAATLPFMSQYGFTWFVSYAGISTVLHHFWFFYLEAFTFDYFFVTFAKVLLNSIYTLFLLVIVQYLFYQEKKK